MTPAFWLLWAVGISLQLFLLQAIVTRQLYRRAPLLSLYILVLFLTGVADMMLYLDIGGWGRNYQVVRIYWINDMIRQIGLLVAVFSFMYQIGRRTGAGGKLPRLLGLAALVLIVAGVVTLHGYGNERWTGLIRNLSFGAVICNFLLWTRLMRGTPDRFLLALTAGAGLQLAGEAVGQSLRSIGLEHRWGGFVTAANYLLVIAHLLCLLIWISAIWTKPPNRQLPVENAAISL